MYVSSQDPDICRSLVRAAGFELMIDDVVEIREPDRTAAQSKERMVTADRGRRSSDQLQVLPMTQATYEGNRRFSG